VALSARPPPEAIHGTPDLDYPFEVVSCAFDAATRGRWRATNKTTVDRNALCIDFLQRRGVEKPETEPAPESSSRGKRSFDHECNAYNSADGCRFGDKCKFKHKCAKCGALSHSSQKCTK
jgi:hypothetical protein